MSIQIEHLSFHYGEREVLTDVSFTAREGELVSVLGPNGVGKSTLFRCMLGLLKPSAGTVKVQGQDISGMNLRELAQTIAYIPQAHHPAFGYTVLDMVLMGTSAHVSAFAAPGAKQLAVAQEALERLGLSDFAGRDFLRLSGGERQLVLIARALAQQSRTLVMDEPTANLDFGNQMRVLGHIRALADAGYTVIQSTHHPEQAYRFSHRILAMQDGRVLADGTPQEVMTAPLMEALYGIEADVVSLAGDRVRVCIPRDMGY